MIDFTRDDILVDYEDFTVRVTEPVENVVADDDAAEAE